MKRIIILMLIAVLLCFVGNVNATSVVVPTYEDSLRKSDYVALINVISGMPCNSLPHCRPGEIDYVVNSKESILGGHFPEKLKLRTPQQLCIGCQYIMLLKVNGNTKKIEQQGLALEVFVDKETLKKEVLFYQSRPVINADIYEYKKDVVCQGPKSCVGIIRYRYVPYEVFIRHLRRQK